MNLKSSLTPLEVSELLKITKNTVYELIKRGELPSYKIGKKIRIDMHDVEEYINNQKSNSKPSINRNIINNSLNNNISNITTNNISLNNPTNSEIIISGQDILLDVLARYIEEILPKDYLHILIEKDLSRGENFRKISITPYGERYNYIKELKI